MTTAGEVCGDPAGERAMAPCGPGCRFASPLAGWPDFVWCARQGAPRSTNRDVDCPEFSPRPDASRATRTLGDYF